MCLINMYHFRFSTQSPSPAWMLVTMYSCGSDVGVHEDVKGFKGATMQLQQHFSHTWEHHTGVW